MRSRPLIVALAFALVGTSEVDAQHFGVMESAEIIQPGNLKFTAYPISIFHEGPADNHLGMALRGGYGFMDFLDGEIGLALFNGATLLGGDLEVGLLRSTPAPGGVDLSVRGGGHLVRGDVLDAATLNIAGIFSIHAMRALDLTGALNFNRRYYDLPLRDFNTLHFVPGVEYRALRVLDFLAEVGLGLDDRAENYISVGAAVYFR